VPKFLSVAPMPLRAVAAPPPPPLPYFSMMEDKVASTVDMSRQQPMLPPSVKRPLSPVPTGDEHQQQNVAASFTATMPPSGPALSLHAQKQAQQQHQARKARRCWSPQLHRQFVAALRRLGGPQGTLHARPIISVFIRTSTSC
jgi:hypothetical protein